MKPRSLPILMLSLPVWAWDAWGNPFATSRASTEAKIAHLNRTIALLDHLEETGADEVAGELTKEDLEALSYAKEPALGGVVLAYCTLRFGPDLRGHKSDPDSFRQAMEYLEAIRFRPCAEPFVQAVRAMDWNTDHQAIMPICAVLKSILFLDVRGPRACREMIDGLLKTYEGYVYYSGGAAWALQALGSEDTVLSLIDIMLRTRDWGPRNRKSHVLTVIRRMLRPDYQKAIARLVEVIQTEPGQNASYAMSLVTPFENDAVDRALVAAATNDANGLSTRGDAIRAIGKRKIARLRDLIESLGRTNPHLHQPVAQALKYIGGSSSLPLLATFLDDHEAIRTHAAEAMGVISEQPFAADSQGVDAARRWWQQETTKSEQSVGP